MNIEKLRAEVLKVGQKNKDKQEIPSSVLRKLTDSSRALWWQILRDSATRYKYYDALAMWLGQWDLWNKQEQNYLLSIAENYLKKRIL